MEKTFLHINHNKENIKDKKNGNFDRMVFILSLLTAAIFWFFIKLSDTYSKSYNLRLQYFNTPINKQLTQRIDSTLTISITANGYLLFENLIKKNLNHVNINLKNCAIEHERSNVYYIEKGNVKKSLSEKLGIPENDIEILKPKLRFVLEKTQRKKLKVKAKVNLKFKSQYGLYHLETKPAYVTVYGPKSILDTMKTIYTTKLLRENLDADLNTSIKIDNPEPKQLRLKPVEVMIKVDVEKYTESGLDIPINLSNIRFRMRTFPKEVHVFYQVAIKNYNEVHAGMFRIVPDIEGVDLDKVQKLNLKLLRKPTFVDHVRFEPSQVEFLIIK